MACSTLEFRISSSLHNHSNTLLYGNASQNIVKRATIDSSTEMHSNAHTPPILELPYTLACGRRESLNGRGAVEALKRQDPNLIRGMATVDKELPTHLNTGN